SCRIQKLAHKKVDKPYCQKDYPQNSICGADIHLGTVMITSCPCFGELVPKSLRQADVEKTEPSYSGADGKPNAVIRGIDIIYGEGNQNEANGYTKAFYHQRAQYIFFCLYASFLSFI